jgi:hypothetical protein
VKRNRTLHDDSDSETARQRERRMPWGLPNDRWACQSPKSRWLVCTGLTKECHPRQTFNRLSGALTGRRRDDGVCRLVPLLNAQAAMKERRTFHDPSQVNAEKLAQDFLAMHPVVQPEPSFLPRQSEYNLAAWTGKKLQVIVQINNHELTPENPTYAGGRWHIEGLLNEHIVGSAIFYYDIENITESRLAFAAVHGPTPRDVDDKIVSRGCSDLSSVSRWDSWVRYKTCTKIYGEQKYNEPRGRVLSLGAVKAIPGRMVVFPNVLEHRVEPFELVDKTRPGHRKMVAIFLVDPAVTIMSTSRVPPQQLHWADDTTLTGRVQGSLPPELGLQVFDQVPCPYDIKTARKIRDELMKERGRGAEASSHKVPASGIQYTD